MVPTGGKPIQRRGTDQFVNLDQRDRQSPETLTIGDILIVKEYRQASDDGVPPLNQFKRSGQCQFLRFDGLPHLRDPTCILHQIVADGFFVTL